MTRVIVFEDIDDLAKAVIHMEEPTNKDELRIECYYCDTDQGDGVTLGAARERGWRRIEPLTDDGELMSWGTHIGLCPDCVKEGVDI